MANVAALYRQSSKKQTRRKAADEVDLPGQRLEVQRFLQAKPDWRLVVEYEEKGVSAYKKANDQRDELQRVFADAEVGKWSILIVFKHDRLGRQGPEYIAALSRLDKAGVRVWSIADNKWLSLDDMEFVLRALEGFSANKASRDTADRVKPRLRQLARAGRWTGGHVPFGYDLQPKRDEGTGQIITRGDRIAQELVPNQYASIIRQLFERYIQGEGTRQIAHWLNSLSELKNCGKIWSQKAVLVTIRNPLYCGWIGYLHGEAGRKMDEETILAPGEHEPIITKEVWDAAQRLLQQRGALSNKQQASTYLLTGIARCGLCGGPLGGITRKNTRADGTVNHRQGYRCLNYVHKGSCDNKNMTAAWIDAAFVEAVASLALPGGLVEFLQARDMQQRIRIADAAAAHQQAQKRLAELDDEMAKVRRDYRSGKLSVDDYNEIRQEIDQERGQLEVELARPLPAAEDKDYSALAAALRDIKANWPYLTPAEQKAFALNVTRAWELSVRVFPDKRVEIRPVNEEGA